MNVDTILADIKSFHAQFEQRAPSSIHYIRIVESELCVRDSDRPRRVHRRRRGMTASYHRRIQKKWAKRFGYEREYTAYRIDPRAAGLPGEPYLVVHRVIAKQLLEQGRPAPALGRSEQLGQAQREWVGLWL